MTYPTAQNAYAISSGSTSTRPLLTVFFDRDPTTSDIQYSPSQRWINTSTANEFILLGFVGGPAISANWLLISSGGSEISVINGDTGFITGNTVSILGNTGTNATGITLTGNNSTQMSLGGDLVVSFGGTGTTSFTAYSVICGGTTSTSALQNVSGVGTSGQVLTSNGAGALPTWQDGSSVLNINTVTHAGSPYTVLSTDQFIAVNCSGGVVTIQLPNTTLTGRVIHIKDSMGASSTNNISITTVGGVVTIDGSTTITLASNFSSASVIFDGSSYEVF